MDAEGGASAGSDRTGLSARRGVVLLAAIGALERVALRLIYSPVSFGDTPSYLRLASALRESGLAGYDGTRVPGYPLFVLALGRDPDRIWLAQMALGWGTALLLFWIGWRTTGSARFGFGLGMLYNLIPGLVLFEANLLSETLTAFCVVSSLALLAAVDAVGAARPVDGSAAASDGVAPDAQAEQFIPAGPNRRWPQLVLLTVLGAASAAAGLVRALFYPLAPWLALFVARRCRRRWLRLALFAVTPALLLSVWVGWVYRQYEMLSPTTMSGYHLVQHTGEYFELLPEEHATIRDIYLKYREARLAERGAQTNAIWDAIPELSEATGLSFFALSAEMQRLSVELILAHPDRYLANVVQGWIDFWKAPAIWDPAALRVDGLAPIFRVWALAGRGVSLAANALFLALSGLGAAAFVAGRRVLARLGMDATFLASAGLVWLTSIVQTLVDHGDNPRFLVPLQMVVIFVVLRAGFHWFGPAGQPARGAEGRAAMGAGRRMGRR